jgi:hypothetical protein
MWMLTMHKWLNYKHEGYQKPMEQVIVFSQTHEPMTSVKL